jgi:PAS domain S-box-containing protein
MNKTILIVENESIIALEEKQILQKEGYNCVIVYSGEKTLEVMNSVKAIDLILMDIDLGSGMDGTETAEKILSCYDLPIIFISSFTDQEIVRKTEKITSYGYIVKDSGPTVLLTSIKMAFKLFDAKQQISKQKGSLELSKFCLDHCGISIFMLNPSGIITYINEYGARNLGYKPEELLGKSITFIDENSDPADWDFSLNKPENFINIESNHKKKDGTLIPVEIRSSNVRFGNETVVFSVVKDLSHEKNNASIMEQTRNAIKMSEAKLKNVMEMAHLGNWELDVEKNQFTFTDELYSLFRTSAEKEGGYQMTPQQYTERFVHPDAKDVVIMETKKAIDTDDPNFSNSLNHKVLFADGEEGYITVRFFIVKDKNGKTIKTYGANQDITDIVRNEQRIESLLTEKDLLLKEIQHRVKNNLRTIESLISLQLAGVKDAAAKDTLNEARQRISIMMNIYKNLSSQDNYHSVNGKIILLETISDIARSYNVQDQIRLDTDIDDFEIAVSSAINICIIINELVTNAYKYAFPHLEKNNTGIISISVKKNNDDLAISVNDNGIGMPKLKLQSKNFGLGLSLVKSMTENSEGTININTEHGTKVSILLSKNV